MVKNKVKIGIIGCGNISSAYLRTAAAMPILEAAAVADIDLERAKAKAAEFNVPKACTVAELLADPSIELVVNLTVPKAHLDVALSALEAGKHVFNEKPLGITVEEGKKILKTAKIKKLRVGCAPGTFLGAGLQTCRKLIDDGAIGRPVGFNAFMLCPGHESWHPSPEFYYEAGGGPLLDMGPYYLTALTSLLGPIARVAGLASIAIPERVIGSEPKRGKKITVETFDHIAGCLEMQNGAIGMLMTSFAVVAHQLPRIEIYGTEGSLSVPDPNSYGGPVRLKTRGDKEWVEMPLTFSHEDGKQKWGLGVADMAYAIRSGRPHRASGENAFHVLETMHAIMASGGKGKHVAIKAPFTRPEPLPLGLGQDALDDC